MGVLIFQEIYFLHVWVRVCVHKSL